MSLESGGMSPADLAAVFRNNGNGGGWGNSGSDAWWFILCMLMCGNGGFGNWGGGGNAPARAIESEMQRGFDHQATTGAIGNLSTQIGQGFADQAVARCQGDAAITQAVTGSQFATVQAIGGAKDTLALGLNQIAMANQQGFNDSRAGLADLKYTVATEACSDRQAVTDGIRDILAQGNQNTNAITSAITAGIQSIKDDLCADRLAAKDAEIRALQNQLNMSTLNGSQVGQTADLKGYIAQVVQQAVQSCCPKPIPSYVVPNPNCGCGGLYGGCAG